ncbi:MAG: hypothetical protein II891_05730 [Bacteroidales bacterium]|nr:hypothetical protein [Bacteroidales bacterium]
MKTRYFFLLAAAALLAGCAKEMQEQMLPEENAPEFYLEVGLAPQTSTVMGSAKDAQDKHKVYWSNGDKIRVNGVESNALAGVAEETQKVTFGFADTPSTPYNVLYPSNIWVDASHVNLPAVQTYRAGGFAEGMDPMAGYSADGSSVKLSHLCAIVKVSIMRAAGVEADTDNIVAVRFKGRNNEQISGSFSINYASATLTSISGAEVDKEVKVAKNQATSTSEAVDYFIVVPAGTYSSGFDVIVKDASGDIMTQSKTSSKTLEAGHLYAMAPFTFVPTGIDRGIAIASAQDLIDFATNYNTKSARTHGLGDDVLVATLTQDIVFDATSSADFNATGGIGTDSGDNFFNGLFNGNSHTISGLKATVPLFAYVGANGRIEDLTLTETCSFDYSSAIAEDKSLGSIAGYSEGDLFNCVNKADVSCSSARTAGVLNIGGVVGRQYATGTISNCANFGSVTCTVDGSSDIYMGGIAGTVERPSSGHTALIKDCVNYGDVKNGIDSGEPAQSCFLHIGGVVGWIYSTSSSANMEISGLINTGNVTKTNNSARADAKAVLVGGIVGGIHGASISDQSGKVAIKNSHVMNCRVQTGSFNNRQGYGEASHVGGFVAVARGNESSKNIIFSDDCYVKDVYVICRRGFAGGFVSWARGAVFSGCHVLSSSVRGSLANCYFAGGIAGCAYDCNLSDCIVLLTKEDSAGAASDSYTLFAQGNNNMAGGIVAQARGTVSIDGCKAYVKNIVQGESGKEAYRGWIIGYIEDNAGITIKDCAIGGASTSATAVTLDADNFDDEHNEHTYGYFYGSKGSDATVSFTGTQSYWEAIKTADITIASYATDHSWVANGSYSIEQGDVTLTPSDNGGDSHNGVFATQWRFYQARGGGLTISVSGGHTLVRATFTYTLSNTGVLLAPDGATQIASGGSCNLSGTSAFFTLGNTGGATNGQVRFTRIVVEYE